MRLTDDQLEAYDPQSYGWNKARIFTSEVFPEVAANREMVWWRDFFIRGDSRLVVEFASGWDLRAVARDGEWLPIASWDALHEAMTRP